MFHFWVGQVIVLFHFLSTVHCHRWNWEDEWLKMLYNDTCLGHTILNEFLMKRRWGRIGRPKVCCRSRASVLRGGIPGIGGGSGGRRRCGTRACRRGPRGRGLLARPASSNRAGDAAMPMGRIRTLASGVWRGSRVWSSLVGKEKQSEIVWLRWAQWCSKSWIASCTVA